MLEKFKNTRWEHLILGAIIFVIGLCFLFFSKSLAALAVLVGIILALCGLSVGSLCILNKKRDFTFIVKISLASLLFVGGVLAIIFNKDSLNALIFAICLLLTVDASFKLYLSIKSKMNSVGGWWIMTAISTAVILSAFFLTKISPDSNTASAIWLGITMIADAADNVLSTVWWTRCKTAEKAAIYYEVYKDIESSR